MAYAMLGRVWSICHPMYEPGPMSTTHTHTQRERHSNTQASKHTRTWPVSATSGCCVGLHAGMQAGMYTRTYGVRACARVWVSVCTYAIYLSIYLPCVYVMCVCIYAGMYDVQDG